MTREEALNKIGELVVYARAQGWDEEFTEAFKALSAEPCGDAVSRQAVLDLIADYDLSMGQVVRGIHAIPSVTPTCSIKPNNCEDAISRDYLLSIANTDGAYGYVSAHDIVNAPSVTPQPKMGQWIIKDDKEQGYDIGGVKTWYVQIMCSECGFIKTAIEGHTGQYKYCPSCGSRMVDPQESENKE